MSRYSITKNSEFHWSFCRHLPRHVRALIELEFLCSRREKEVEIASVVLGASVTESGRKSSKILLNTFALLVASMAPG